MTNYYYMLKFTKVMLFAIVNIAGYYWKERFIFYTYFLCKIFSLLHCYLTTVEFKKYAIKIYETFPPLKKRKMVEVYSRILSLYYIALILVIIYTTHKLSCPPHAYNCVC